MKITFLEGTIGAEVTGLDLGGVWDNSTVHQLDAAFRSRLLLVFRDPELRAEDQVRLVQAFGLSIDEWAGGEQFGFLSNSRADAPNVGQHNPYLFHSDLTWKEQPIAAISLFAMVIPDEPVPTFFASGVGAAAALPPKLRDRLVGQRGLFLSSVPTGDRRNQEETASPEAPRATQPVLYEDPVSGQTSLIIDSLFMDSLVGWDRDTSESLREEVHGYLYDPSNVYRHDWSVGDLVLWNNVALQHARPELPSAERTHRRVSGTFKGRTTRWDATFRN
jgi:alpha-ketoglutarate-dependent taurine dioxygenase